MCILRESPLVGWASLRYVKLDAGATEKGLIQAYRFIFDSRDRATEQRLDDLDRDPYRLFRCRTFMNCAEVCPKGLEPVRAIEAIRLKIARVGPHLGGLDTHPPISPK